MGGYEDSFPSSIARCTLTTILQLHFTDGETVAHRGEGTLPRSHRASKAEHRPEPGLQVQCSLPYKVSLAKPGNGEQRTFSLNQRVKFRRRRKKRSSRRSSQGWSPAQLVPGLREGGNDAAWGRGSLRSTIRRESACGSSQKNCRGSGKDG